MIIIRKFVGKLSSLSVQEAKNLSEDLQRAIEEAKDHETSFSVPLVSNEGEELLVFVISPFIKSAIEMS